MSISIILYDIKWMQLDAAPRHCLDTNGFCTRRLDNIQRPYAILGGLAKQIDFRSPIVC